jgi:hypothetical protein
MGWMVEGMGALRAPGVFSKTFSAEDAEETFTAERAEDLFVFFDLLEISAGAT